ncbi:MAG: hypothetical protein Q4D26_04430 [Clostridia bacterium]|nr:hypothetical protein [Clostridia bacterium]
MNKYIKITLSIISGILALITAVGLIYGIQNKITTNNIYSSYDENISNAVENSIAVCVNAFYSVGATNEETDNLNDYLNNINEAESPVLKAYIADSMLTYTGDFVMVKEQNYIAAGKSSNFNDIQEKLVSTKSQLTSARNYNQK